MPAPRDLRQVDSDYATTGPNRNTLHQMVAASATDLFACLEDAEAWNDWLDLEVEWTSPEPFGVGTTRTVKTLGQTMDETFLAWEPGRRMNFRFERATLPMKAFAENYLIEPNGPDRCELVWTYSYEFAGPLARVAEKIFGIVFARKAGRGLTKLAALVEVRTLTDHPDDSQAPPGGGS